MSHPHLTSDLNALLDRVSNPGGLAEILAQRRVFATDRPCMRCSARAILYEGDSRARGWLRGECPNGHFWDQNPTVLAKTS